MSELGKFKHLGYHPLSCGRSYHKVKCECGRIEYIFAWRGTKKCECGKILNMKYSPEGKDIAVTAADLGIMPVPQVKVTAPCNDCGKEIHYVHGVGWCHSEGAEFDHVALPVSSKIKREMVKDV